MFICSVKFLNLYYYHFVSDSGVDNVVIPANITKDPWTKPIKELWQHLLLNFSAEQSFNQTIGKTEPHCSICALFKPLSVSIAYYTWTCFHMIYL